MTFNFITCMFLTLITFIVILSLLVFVHELGHFWVAKRCGLTPKEFGFGFPPRAWGVYKDQNGNWKRVRSKEEAEKATNTIYSVNWVPLGGFVNIGEDDEAGDNPNHFNNKPVGQRAIILLAGVTMNIILAAVLISFGFMIGLPQVISDGISAEAKISNEQIQIVEVMKDSPAEKGEIKIGDVIESINGEKFSNGEELQKYVALHTGEKLNYKVKRGQKEITKEIIPEIRPETNMGGIGIGITETGIVKYPFLLSIWHGLKTTFTLIWAIIAAFYELIKSLIAGKSVSAEIAGPVGIAALTGQVTHMGFIYVLQFTALLSINLAIINAFPFPALDGGRLIFLAIEKIKGRPVKKEVERAIHNIGFALLMILVLLVTFQDVSKYGSKFKMLWEKIIG